MLDRKQKPQLVSNITIPQVLPDKAELLNGIPVYSLTGLQDDISQIVLKFPVGQWNETKRLQGIFLTAMLFEGGTKNKSSKKILEEVYFYGFDVNFSSGFDYFYITIETHNNTFQDANRLAFEMFTEPSFNKNEFEKLRSRFIEWYKQNLVEPSWLAERELYRALYGENNYGYFQTEEDYQSISVEDIQTFYSQVIETEPEIFLVTNSSHDFMTIFNKYWSKLDKLQNKTLESVPYITSPQIEDEVYIERKDAIQSSIAVASLLPITKKHDDYIDIVITNFILGGGFFNARLISNIREDKGYTYGIFSSIGALVHAMSIDISSDIKVDVTKATLTEVKKEIQELQTRPAPDEDMELIKQNLKARIAKSMSMEFKQMAEFRSFKYWGINVNEFYKTYLKKIEEFSNERMFEIARKYFKPENFITVVVGKK